ncbi:MAG: hypothetical protein HY022_10315 [Chloroflexi bacterium]|nr:hypothetical protein [Chloroflexota bacterium]
MAELLHKQLSFSIIGAAMEVHNVLGSLDYHRVVKSEKQIKKFAPISEIRG